jgi:hypothetical protein
MSANSGLSSLTAVPGPLFCWLRVHCARKFRFAAPVALYLCLIEDLIVSRRPSRGRRRSSYNDLLMAGSTNTPTFKPSRSGGPGANLMQHPNSEAVDSCLDRQFGYRGHLIRLQSCKCREVRVQGHFEGEVSRNCPCGRVVRFSFVDPISTELHRRSSRASSVYPLIPVSNKALVPYRSVQRAAVIAA